MAAPPKPSTPPTSDDPRKKKQKVTPVQVAFLVERYLADNGFSASLAAFRSDAAHLFSKTSTANLVPPKGLLPLADILRDYIALKEARLAVDSAMQAMHTLVSTYYSNSSASASPPLPLPPPSSPPLVPPLFVAPSPPQPPPGAGGYASPIIHYTQTSSVVVQNSSGVSTMSTPAPSSLSLPTKKRKATKSTTSASKNKKACTAALTTTTSRPKVPGKAAASQHPHDNMCSAAQPSSAQHTVMAKLLAQGSTVAKSLFKPQVHSSPCTPLQSHPIEDEPAAHQTERPSSVVLNAHAQEDIASSQCSIVSSKTVIVSPLKGAAYYAVERSYHVSSPLKQGTHKSSKREHVKGKLDFGSSDARTDSTEQICGKASTSDGEKKDDFDIDFTDFDMFDGDFSFSELLLDLDLDTQGTDCQNPSTIAQVQRLEPIAKSNYVMADPVLPDLVKTMGVDPTEDIDSQGATSVTSVRAITKRIKIVSPAKGRRAFQST